MTNRRPRGQWIEVASAPVDHVTVAESSARLRDLFDMHASYIWNALRRLGAAPSDLEDLTHDVFVQVHHHLGDYDPARPVRPWLFGFALRIASQNRRRAYRRHETRGEPDAATHPGAAPDEQLAVEEDRRLIIDALQGIDLERRAVFVLYEIDGEAMADIASSLNIPVNTAYSRLRVARTEFAAAVKRLRATRGSHG